jgi:hypothetical protein
MNWKDRVLHQHTLNQCCHWIVSLSGEKGSTVARTNDRDYTWNESHEDLERYLDNLMPGKYAVRFKTTYKDTAGQVYLFTCEDTGVRNSNTTIAGIGGYSEDDVEARAERKAQAMLAGFKNELEIDRLSRELKEAKDKCKDLERDASKTSPIENRLADVIGTIAPSFVKHYFPEEKQQQRAAVGSVITTELEVDDNMSDADVQRLQTTLERLADNEPKWLDYLEKMAHIKQTNKAMYNMAINMLITA